MSSAANIKLGPCFVKYKGVDLGYTKGGVDVDISTATRQIALAQDGDVPRAIYIVGRVATITVPLVETQADKLKDFLQLATHSAGTTTVLGGVGVELLALAGELVAAFVLPNGAKVGASVFPRALCDGNVKYAYQVDNERIFHATFIAYPAVGGTLLQVVDAYAT